MYVFSLTSIGSCFRSNVHLLQSFAYPVNVSTNASVTEWETTLATTRAEGDHTNLQEQKMRNTDKNWVSHLRTYFMVTQTLSNNVGSKHFTSAATREMISRYYLDDGRKIFSLWLC